MRIAQDTFQGILPRLAPQRLSAANAQDATNARLLSGDLESWRQFSSTRVLATAAPVETIYELNGSWLSWQVDVDAARGPVPGDTTFRLYLTGPDVYATPRFTNYALATTGAEPFPVVTRPLGVPAPGLGPFVIGVPASGVTPVSVTGYAYTYVNDLGQESAPSQVTVQDSGPFTVFVPLYAPTGNGDFNHVTMHALETGVSSDYGINTVRLYREATGSTGTVLRFVADVGFTGVPFTYDDFLVDSQLGEVIPSETWDLPPDALHGLLALPNGVMAGFVGNQLCLSAQNFPHAWPVLNRYTTDTDIVGIGNIDTTVVIFTQSFLYVASGSDPAQYGMAKFEIPYAGVAKQSITYVDGVGVVGATPDGLRAVAGVGQSLLVTKSIFTREQWQALKPESIQAYAHEGIYFMFYDTGTVKAGYAIDASSGGFGMVPLSFHATAGYTDPLTDRLHLVLDTIDEPTDVLLPLSSTAPTVTGHTIFEFDSATGNGRLVYRYRGRLNIMSYPTALAAAQVRCRDFANVVWRVFADGALLFETVLTSNTEFTLPMTDEYDEIEFEFVGTSAVRNMQAAEDMTELT